MRRRNHQHTRGWTLARKLEFYSDRSGGDDACWPWLGRTEKKLGFEYGLLHWQGRGRRAHRLAWEEGNGPVPDGLKVCHHCDNPPCVNPSHLFVGTQGDNVADMVKKGRGNSPKGEGNAHARLTPEIIHAILVDARPQKDIAAELGISQAHVSALQLGKAWVHLGCVARAPKVRAQYVARGINHPHAKLCENDVRQIGASTDSGRALARKFQVSPICIAKVRARQAWAHVADIGPGDAP